MALLTQWLIIFAILVLKGECRDPRSAQELTRCIRISEPLIHDPNYVFPLTTSEIGNVCEMWDHFVDCVRKYTTTFLSRPQQEEFDKAINPSMQSIHQLCIKDEQYQKAYLYYAPCMKKIAIEQKFCGGHYNFLAKIAESSSETGPAICCGYHKFRTCVLKEASRECDKDDDPTRPTFGSDSSHFVSSMLNRALGFLLQKCSDYEPSSQDCLSYLSSSSNLNTNIFITPSENNEASNNLGMMNVQGRHNSNSKSPRDDRFSDDWNFSIDQNRPRNNDGNSFSSSSSSDSKPSVTIYPPSPPAINKFTWTTTNTPPSFFPTKNSSRFENEIREPESQEYRGSGMSPCVTPFDPKFTLFVSATVFILPNIFSYHLTKR